MNIVVFSFFICSTLCLTDLQPSSLVLPVSIDLKALQKIANDNLPRRYDNFKTEGKLKYLALKDRGDLEISAQDNYIHFSCPIGIVVKVRLLALFVIKGKMRAKCSMSVSINDDWTLNADVRYLDYDWIDKPTINGIDLFHIVRSTVNNKFQENKNFIKDEIRKVIHDSVPLRRIVEDFRNELQESMEVSLPLNGNKKAYLTLSSVGISSTQLSAHNNYLTSHLRMEASFFESSLEKGCNKYSSLPPYAVLRPPYDMGFHINHRATLKYSLLSSMLVNQQISAEMVEVKVTSAFFSGQPDGKVDVSVSAVATVEGIASQAVKGYFSGVPVFNAETQSLTLTQVEPSVEMKNNFFTPSLNKVKPKVQSVLQEHTTIHLQEYMDTLVAALNTLFRTWSLDGGWRADIHGKVKGISVTGVVARKEDLVVDFHSFGEIGLRIEL